MGKSDTMRHVIDREHPDWEAICHKKAQEIDDQIPERWRVSQEVRQKAKGIRQTAGSFIEDLLPAAVLEITKNDSVTLVKRIGDGTCAAVEVAEAFCHRAAVAQQIGNCLHEFFFEQALARAKELDAYLAKHGRTVGPLHGLPISLKDQFHVKGVETFMGYAGWVGTFEGREDATKYKSVDSTLVTCLKGLGAVLYCKTSLPQTLAFSEVHNNVIGYTWNPHNQEVSCGGSSGGEAALQSLGASSLGIGTDQGGSVRIPGDFCGLYSIKPSTGRFPYGNIANNNPGQVVIPSTVGFIATARLSLRLLMLAILSAKPWELDAETLEMPWRVSHELEATKEGPSRKLCFGVLHCDGVVTPHPPVQRSLKIAVRALRHAGHEVIPWEPPSHAEANAIHGQTVFSDMGADMARQARLSGEPLVHEISRFIPTPQPPPLPLLDVQDLALRKRGYSARYLAYWMSTAERTATGMPVDAVLMPVAPHAAVLNDKFMYYGYTNVGNLLDYTSATVPVTKADRELDPHHEHHAPLNDLDGANWRAYDAEIYHGSPVGVQIMGRRLQEEFVLSVAGVVDQALKDANASQAGATSH